MSPAWYDIAVIPYEKMWEDDEIWIPRLLRGERVNYKFYFTQQGKLLSYNKIEDTYLVVVA